MEIFPNQRATGIDLGDVDIKESHGKYHRIVLGQKDYSKKIKFFICYNHVFDEFLIVDSQDLEVIKAKKKTYKDRNGQKQFKKQNKSYYWNYLRKIAMHTTNDLVELWNITSKLSKFKELINPFKIEKK